MNYKRAIREIKALLNIEVKFEQIKLEDGVTIIEADAFEAGQKVFIVDETENIPLPIGEYTLEDGRKLTVEEEGMIMEIKDAVAEEVEVEAAGSSAPGTEPEQSPLPEASPEGTEETDSTDAVVYVTKEEFDSAMEEIRSFMEELKAYIGMSKENMTKVITEKDEEITKLQKELNEKPAAKKIVHNPELKESVDNKNVSKLSKIFKLIEK